MTPIEKALLERAGIDLTFEEKHGLVGRKEYRILVLKLYLFFKKIDNPKISKHQLLLDASNEFYISKGTAQNYCYRDLGVRLPNIFGIRLQKKPIDSIEIAYYSIYYTKEQQIKIKSPEIYSLISAKTRVMLVNNRSIENHILTKKEQKLLIGTILA